MTNGEAQLANKAFQFGENTSFSLRESLNFMDREYTEAELREILDNPYLSAEDSNLIGSYLDGSLREAVTMQREAEKLLKKAGANYKGYVYLILAENGLYKIGKAKNVSERLKPFSVSFPMKWELVCSFHSTNYNLAEASLHQKYADRRDIGEWFKLTEEDVEFIKAIEDDKL